jgi:hypothetical protein
MNQKIAQPIHRVGCDSKDQFISDISMNIKLGLRNKAENGRCPYSPPIGYLADSGKNRFGKEAIIDPNKFKLIKKAFSLISSGKNTPLEALEIATSKWSLTNKKGNRISYRSWLEMLSNTFYYGEFEYPKGSGRWYKGNHIPMLTQIEFSKIKAILNK